MTRNCFFLQNSALNVFSVLLEIFQRVNGKLWYEISVRHRYRTFVNFSVGAQSANIPDIDTPPIERANHASAIPIETGEE